MELVICYWVLVLGSWFLGFSFWSLVISSWSLVLCHLVFVFCFLFGIWCLGFGIFLLLYDVRFIVKQNPYRRRIFIFVLPGADRPDKGDQEAYGYQQTYRDEKKDYVH